MIDMWGINTKDDLMFKYLVDQKKVDGPRLGRHTYIDDKYAAGVFSPWNHRFSGDSKDKPGTKLHAPFSSAQDGAQPDANGWTFDNVSEMQTGRSTDEMAKGMYRTGIERPALTPRDTPRGYGRG